LPSSFDNPAIIVSLITASAALLGALVGTCGTLFVTWISKRSEERRHLREITTRTAVEYWAKRHEMVLAHPTPGESYQLMPLDGYVVHLVALSKLLEGSNLSEESAVQILRKAQQITEACDKEIRSRPSPRISTHVG
jgi:hypothetical protein